MVRKTTKITQEAIEEGLKGYYNYATAKETLSGIPIKEKYTPEDIKDINYENDIGEPGEYPYTRGVYPNMYRGRLWSIRELAGFWSGEETNRRLKYLISHGETAINTISDNPSNHCIDPDHPIAAGDAGVQGIPTAILQDIEELTEGIPLDKVSWTFSAPQSFMYMPMYITIAQRRGNDISKLRGTSTGEFLIYVATCGRRPDIRPPALCVKLVSDVIEFCSKYMPKWNPVSCNGYDWREVGVGAAEEIGFVFSLGLEYIREGLRRGMSIDEIAPKITFDSGCQIEFFEEIAKFRAARKVWAYLMRERFGAKEPRSWKFKYHVNTSGVSLIRQQPENNIIRIAIETLAAAIGGTNSMCTMGYLEPVCLPTEEAHRISVRTNQIVAYETGVANVVDPIAGSYYVESLTATIEEKIKKLIDEIDGRGGFIAALESGWIYTKIDEAASHFQQQVENKDRLIVGQNCFTMPEKPRRNVHKINANLIERRIARFKEFKASRDRVLVKSTLKNLSQEAEKDANLIPAILEAVKAYATIGEVTGIIRMAHGYNYDPFGMIKCPF